MLAAACPSCLIKPGGLCQRLDVKIERREAREGLSPSCALTCALPAVRLLLEELELDDSGRVEDDVTDLVEADPRPVGEGEEPGAVPAGGRVPRANRARRRN